MIRDEIPISAQVLQWRCVESRVDSARLHYSRFAISPFRSGQASTVGIAMRRALLGEVEGTCITCAEFKRVTHEYSTILGIQESVHDVLINLGEIVLRSDSYETQKAFISILGPKKVTAQDIILPPSVKIIDTTQYIATVTKAIHLDIELKIEKDFGYRIEDPIKSADGNFPVDAVFMPIRNVNYSVHSFENGNETQEILFLEIWTNGSVTPKEALYEASRSLINLFIPFLHAEKKEFIYGLKNTYESNMSYFSSPSLSADIDEMTKGVTFKHIFIDQLELPARAYNCLKRVNAHTISDLLNYSQDDLMKIKNFGKKSVEQVLEALQKRFSINLPKNKLHFH
uniref:DNA-directed RNA polymerase subunit alpha n=1 Tax=Takakia lepidozioides TaxID=37425 RepID=RPOA_TAKLE|nr:RecName: Full=DNA-directed RNA polymerase subunit alpha; Short=PEP; AltName: Full=Plastid-encoded RNA polymerase subunit alpha; Short=RNA polymerase subunit alpha [Takakia lepidozioides]BAD60944.2 DNA-dependent RNA polymerase alpha subunit [Takakia lepidozioides]